MGAAETKQYAERMDKQIKVALKNRKADGRKKDISLNQKDLQDLFEQIAFEYPYFDSIADSAIMTDHQLPDEPIIYCNDEFTALTGYPKEDILGRNCRFLQGKYTDPKHVDKIRNALKSGTKLEIELLNYRRDGTPFINGFLMLPLHKKGKTDGVVTHFLAVQKNVTVLVNPWKQPMNQWTVPEVCMWLEKNESPSYIKQFLAKDVDGKKLSAMSMESLSELGVALTSEKERLYRLITQAKAERRTERLINNDETSQSEDTTSRIITHVSESDDSHSERSHKPSSNRAKLMQAGGTSLRKTMVTCRFSNDQRPPISVLGSSASMTLSEMQKVIRRKTGRKYSVQSMESSDGRASSLAVVMEPTSDGLLPEYFAVLEGSKLPIIITDNAGIIVFCNERTWEVLALPEDPMDQFILKVLEPFKCPVTKMTFVTELRKDQFSLDLPDGNWDIAVRPVRILKAKLHYWTFTPAE